MLFTSDEDLVRLQQQASRPAKGVELSVSDRMRTAIDDSRELREHQRWREFAMLLFVWPVAFAVLYQIVLWSLRHFVGGSGQ